MLGIVAGPNDRGWREKKIVKLNYKLMDSAGTCNVSKIEIREKSGNINVLFFHHGRGVVERSTDNQSLACGYSFGHLWRGRGRDRQAAVRGFPRAVRCIAADGTRKAWRVAAGPA